MQQGICVWMCERKRVVCLPESVVEREKRGYRTIITKDDKLRD